MIWIILEILAASFAMGMWTSNFARRQGMAGFLWIVALILIINYLEHKL
jgi:hypothetical protein